MNDFNRGALPIPCLRLDYGFGEQWASVELGDGTGYVRLADCEKAVDENAKLRKAMDFQALELGCMTDNRDVLYVENKNLRELVRDMMGFFEDGDWCVKCERARDCQAQEQYEDDCLMRFVFRDRMRELGIEVEHD